MILAPRSCPSSPTLAITTADPAGHGSDSRQRSPPGRQSGSAPPRVRGPGEHEEQVGEPVQVDGASGLTGRSAAAASTSRSARRQTARATCSRAASLVAAREHEAPQLAERRVRLVAVGLEPVDRRLLDPQPRRRRRANGHARGRRRGRRARSGSARAAGRRPRPGPSRAASSARRPRPRRERADRASRRASRRRARSRRASPPRV